MAGTPGTNVWGNIYRENRDKSLAARHNVGHGSYTSPSINSGAANYNWGGFHSTNQFGGYTNTFTRATVTNSSGFPANHYFGRYMNDYSNTTYPINPCSTPEKRLNWAYMVDSVFKEEIGKMAGEFKNGQQ